MKFLPIDNVREALREHWLTSTNCSHERLVDPTPRDQPGTNYASCSCSQWRGPERNSVGAAVNDWAEHVLAVSQGGE